MGSGEAGGEDAGMYRWRRGRVQRRARGATASAPAVAPGATPPPAARTATGPYTAGMNERHRFAARSRFRALVAAIGVVVACRPGPAAEPAGPRAVTPRHTITLLAADPDIVTPVGCTHDARGRLLVIESHTHFRPANYPGPPHDRIRIVEDGDGDGRADRFHTFFEGTRATMALRAGADGWIYVATRSEVFRIRDSDGDDVADARERIALLETKGDYPHDGLGGLAFDAAGRLVFGLGENLGHAYRLVAADGSSWSGGGEGGAVFRCAIGGDGAAAGSRLERVATGFWNPFGLCVDPVGRLFAVDNDPDGRPPCRLIDVAPCGDYGYQFRYGRGGRHPLQAWDGELPGTLPMAAGTGEAPCSVVVFDGALWVTSWGANRIESFRPTARGAGAAATGTVVVQGGPDFRPVDAALAPDGSLIVSDWVDRSYDLHRRGRIWRIAPAAARDSAADWPAPSPGELRARRLAGSAADGGGAVTAAPRAELLVALGDDDPFLRQAAVAGLVTHAGVDLPDLAATDDPRRRLGILMAHRSSADIAASSRAADDAPPRPASDDASRDALLRTALADGDDAVRLYAVRWIADARLRQFRADVDALLTAPQSSPRLLAGAVAALAWLDGQGFDGDAARRRLAAIWRDARRPAAVRSAALAISTPAADADALDPLVRLATARTDAEHDALAREAVRLLALWPAAAARPALQAIATDVALPAERRADAVAGIVRHDAASPLLGDLARDADATVARAAATLPAAAAQPDAVADRPAAADTAAWLARLDGPGDAAAGWRLFFAGKRGRCAACHALGGRGAAIGPDLSGIVARAGRARVLESLLQPDKEIGPAFQAYAVGLADGRVVTGLSLGLADGDRRERFVGADGTETVVDVAAIESRLPLAASVMPSGLAQGLSDDELRDLLALLAE